MVISEKRFLETRAAQLAAVLLTRHSDVSVEIEPAESGYGVDLLVSLLDNGQNVGRLMGIEVQAVRPTTRPQARDQALREASRLRRPAVTHIPFPVCLFVFTMDDDRGYWRWVRQPVASQADPRGLIDVQDQTLTPLSDEAIAGILATVRAWYR